MTTGERIKSKREALGLSQEELAQKVGYTDRTSIAKVEAGKVDLPESKILAFADALGVTPAYLCGWDEAKAETELDLQRRLRRAIGAKGFSYARLERLTGIPKSCIQRYATGTTKEIPAGKVKILADALDVDLLWMMGQPVNEEEKEEKKTVENNDQTYTLYENVNGMRVQLGCKMTLIEVNAAIENHVGIHGATQFIVDVEMKNKLGERLRELRTYRGLSQWQVSEILGTSKSSIAMYERGEREPGVQMLMSMAQFYRVSIDYLVGMTDKKEEN